MGHELHGAAGLAQHAVSDAAEDEAPHDAMTVGPRHDELGAVLVRKRTTSDAG
jgi:hypothetical protein